MSPANAAATLVVIALVLLAALHFYWGAGGRWPGHDDRSLVDLVVGRTRNMKAPDSWACLSVTCALLAAAISVALYSSLVELPLAPWARLIVQVAFWAASAVFAARGVAGFVPAIFRYAEGTPFAQLNRRYYSPLCLLIAAGFVAVHFTAG